MVVVPDPLPELEPLLGPPPMTVVAEPEPFLGYWQPGWAPPVGTR